MLSEYVKKVCKIHKRKRAFSEKPSGGGKRISIAGAVKFGKMISCMKFEEALDGSIFYIKILSIILTAARLLFLTLDLVISTGAKVLFLPPCRPELNQIEYLWSIVKK